MRLLIHVVRLLVCPIRVQLPVYSVLIRAASGLLSTIRGPISSYSALLVGNRTLLRSVRVLLPAHSLLIRAASGLLSTIRGPISSYSALQLAQSPVIMTFGAPRELPSA